MKFRRRLVLYYLIATLLSTFSVGFAVLRGIEVLSMGTIERHLLAQSRLAEIYISQVAFLDDPDADVLSVQSAQRIITNLGLILGSVRIYDTHKNLLASTDIGVKSALTEREISDLLSRASEGNYAYMVRNNQIHFASPLDLQGETFGLLEIIYPLNFLTTLLQGVTEIFLVGAIGFAVMMTLLSIYIAGRVTKPINQLVKATHNYARQDFTPVNIKSSDEIAQLCESFNSMGARLKEYIQQQKLFVSNVSHELKTPLTAIKGYSEYRKDEVENRPDLQKAVYHLNNEAERLTRLIDEILTLSRIDSDREKFSFGRVNFSQLVEETAEKMSVRVGKYDIRMKLETKPDIYVRGDSEKLVQVLVNLFDNAIKFSPKHSTVLIRLYKSSSMAVLTVTDQGIGIPPHQIPRVFERFYRADNAKAVSGTGLGLSIVKHIVDAHKGNIKLSSDGKSGTTATLELPIIK